MDTGGESSVYVIKYWIERPFWVETANFTGPLTNALSSTTIGAKTPMEVWLEKTQQIMISFECLVAQPIIMSQNLNWILEPRKSFSWALVRELRFIDYEILTQRRSF